MAKAKKLSSGNWRCLAYIGKDKNGKRKYKSFTAPTKKEAELLALSYEPSEEERPKSSVKEYTLGELTDEYIEMKRNLLSVSTISGYLKIRNNYLPELFDTKLGEISSTVLQRYVNDEALEVSSKTLKNRFGLIIAVLRNFDPDGAYNIKYPRQDPKDIHIPSTEDVKRMWEYSKDTDMEIPILLGAYVGMRRSEICAADELKDGRILINKVMLQNESGSWVIQHRTKTEAGTRLAYPPPFVLEALKRHPLPVSLKPHQIDYRFREMLKKLKMPEYRFHDLRHFYASALMSAGIPDKYVIERIGHTTDHMLKTVYQHTMKERNKEIDCKIDNLFS